MAGVDYQFNAFTGVVTLKRAGNWRITYQDRADADDPAASLIDARGVLSVAGGPDGPAFVELRGRSLLGSVDLDALTSSGPRRLKLMLTEGGIPAGVSVTATTFDVVGSQLTGDLAGVLRVRSVLGVLDRNELEIAGSISGTLDILNDLGAPGVASGVQIIGDLTPTGRIQVGQTLYGRLTLTGDALDGVGNWIRIRRMSGGRLEMRDLRLRLSDGADWCVIGHGLTVPELAATTQTGTVAIHGALSGRLYIRGYSSVHVSVNTIDAADDAPWRDGGIEATSGYTAESRIDVASFVRGRIGLPRDLLPASALPTVTFAGEIDVTGDLPAAARIDTLNPGTSGGQRAVDLAAMIHIHGNLAGKVQATGGLSGQVRIDGSLVDGVAGDEVEIAGPRSGIGAVTVDYDGWNDGDNWQNGATVRIGGQVYAANTPAARVWEVTCCRGDTNNDGLINFFDIDPYLMVLFDTPGPGSYSALLPGLDGSRVYHADLNCDGRADFFDIDPFVAALFSGACSYDCLQTCGAGGSDPGPGGH